MPFKQNKFLKVLIESALRYTGLNCHQQHQHSMRAQVRIPAVLPFSQLPAHVLEKAEEDDPNIWVPEPNREIQTRLAPAWPSCDCCGHMGISLSLSPTRSVSVFQINKSIYQESFWEKLFLTKILLLSENIMLLYSTVIVFYSKVICHPKWQIQNITKRALWKLCF